MGSRSRIFAPKTHLPLNHPPAPQPETMADGDVSACFDAGNSFNTKLKDALSGLVKANNDRKSEIDALRGDHDQLKKDHDALEVTTTRENDLRKNDRISKETSDRENSNQDLQNRMDSQNSDRISRHRHRHLHLPLWRNLHVPVPHRHPRQQEGSAVHPQER